VRVMAKCHGEEWLVMVVNVDNERHMATVISGMESLDGKTLHLLYGEEKAVVRKGELVLRMQPYEVKVFSTDPKRENPQRKGRDF